MHVPLIQILLYLAVTLGPKDAREIQITAPRFSAHWVLTDQGWQGGQYNSKAIWKLATKAPAPSDSLEPWNPDWTRAVIVEGGSSPGTFPVNWYVDPLLGHDWTTGAEVEAFLRSKFAKTKTGFVYSTHDGNGQERKYEISYDNDGSPYTDVVLSSYTAFRGPKFTDPYTVGLRAKAKSVDRLPPWTSEDDAPPPISVGRVLELVQKERARLRNPHIANIRLGHHVRDDDGRDFYYYDVEIDSQEPQTFGGGPHIGVLLDGTLFFTEPAPWQDP